MADQKRIWVISGTHWDREWRYTADQSLVRLAALMDEMIGVLESVPEFTCFHLDGGTIIVEDYLEVRPENADRLKKLMAEGRAVSVPWYTLPEMNAVSPEALVRNMLVAKRTDREIGGAMVAGYTATSYGQISQLPQLYAGFGLNSVLTYRGTNKHQVPPISLWQAPDGTKLPLIRCFDDVTRTNWFFVVHYMLVLGRQPRQIKQQYDATDWPVHMADETLYNTAFQVLNEKFGYNTDPEKMSEALRHFLHMTEKQAIGNELMGLDMEDNAVPYRNLPKVIDALNGHQKDYDIRLAPLDDFVDAALKAVEGQDLPVLTGELRYTAIEPGFNGLLGGTGSSRIDLKVLNHTAETDLISVAEPLCSIAAMHGAEYPRTFLERAWLKLLKNHAHDSICGAAISEALDDMPTRFRDVSQLGRETSRKACEALWLQLDTASKFEEGDLTITLFNPQPFERSGVVPAVLDVPAAEFDKPMDPMGTIYEGVDMLQLITGEHFDLIDENGNAVEYTVRESQEIRMEVERFLDSNAITYKVNRHHLLMNVTVPPLGWATYALRPRKPRFEPFPTPQGDRGMIAGPGGSLENDHLKLQLNPNGTFDLTDKATGHVMAGQHFFADNGSHGDGHFVKMPLRDFVVTTLGNAAKITLTENSPLRATWQVDLVMDIPAEVDQEARDRSPYTKPLPITSWITLKKGSRRVEIKTHIENRIPDHRLRAMFPTELRTNTVHAESAFDVVERCFQWPHMADNHEQYHAWQPMLHFLSLNDDAQGFAFMSKGLREYEVFDDPRRTLAVTLARGHRAYMRPNKPPYTPEERWSNTGPHLITDLTLEYAIMPHTGDWRAAGVLNESRDYTTPWRIIQGIPKEGTLAPTQSVIEVGPVEHVHLAALCQGEDGSGYTLRLWNSSDQDLEARIVLPKTLTTAAKVRLDETGDSENLKLTKGTATLPMRGKEIVTIRLG